MSETSEQQRTVVFVDYQNVYRSAREAFGWQDEPGHFGNFRPYGLGRQMVRPSDRTLHQVRVYTGIHTPQRNQAQYSQMQRRMRAWIAESPGKVELFPRPLRYSVDRPRGQEKGVDVELAIDFVRLALDDEFEVAVLASTDTDLVPALQFVADRFPDKGLVTVALDPLEGCEPDTAAPLDLPRGTVERLKIPKRDFDRMADKRNFYLAAADPKVDESRWSQVKRRFDPS